MSVAPLRNPQRNGSETAHDVAHPFRSLCGSSDDLEAPAVFGRAPRGSTRAAPSCVSPLRRRAAAIAGYERTIDTPAADHRERNPQHKLSSRPLGMPGGYAPAGAVSALRGELVDLSGLGWQSRRRSLEFGALLLLLFHLLHEPFAFLCLSSQAIMTSCLGDPPIRWVLTSSFSVKTWGSLRSLSLPSPESGCPGLPASRRCPVWVPYEKSSCCSADKSAPGVSPFTAARYRVTTGESARVVFCQREARAC